MSVAETLYDYYSDYTIAEMESADFSMFGDSSNMIQKVLETIANKNIFTEKELFDLEFAMFDANAETAKNAFITGYKAARNEIPELH